ncbi:MAG TPA: hypothetical protein V6C90_05695 [Coleofasciculaceae cyanobacterium]|jgi:hypothetical protein
MPKGRKLATAIERYYTQRTDKTARHAQSMPALQTLIEMNTVQWL